MFPTSAVEYVLNFAVDTLIRKQRFSVSVPFHIANCHSQSYHCLKRLANQAVLFRTDQLDNQIPLDIRTNHSKRINSDKTYDERSNWTVGKSKSIIYFPRHFRLLTFRVNHFSLRGSYFDRARSVNVNPWTSSNSILIKRDIFEYARSDLIRTRRIQRQRAPETHQANIPLIQSSHHLCSITMTLISENKYTELRKMSSEKLEEREIK